jgi:hypothetical protein
VGISVDIAHIYHYILKEIQIMNKYRIQKKEILNLEGEVINTEYKILVRRNLFFIEWYEELTELNFYFGVYIQQEMKFETYGEARKHIDSLL